MRPRAPETNWPALLKWIRLKGCTVELPGKFPGLALLRGPAETATSTFVFMESPEAWVADRDVRRILRELKLSEEEFFGG